MIDDECIEITNKLKVLIDLFNLIVKSSKPLSEKLEKSTLPMIYLLILTVSGNKGISQEVFNEFKNETVNLI